MDSSTSSSCIVPTSSPVSSTPHPQFHSHPQSHSHIVPYPITPSSQIRHAFRPRPRTVSSASCIAFTAIVPLPPPPPRSHVSHVSSSKQDTLIHSSCPSHFVRIIVSGSLSPLSLAFNTSPCNALHPWCGFTAAPGVVYIHTTSLRPGVSVRQTCM
ncbi:hypothetical protein BD413DRAFT_64208 [Trametes elegans]|nr:hypothetical protein BD413DRAFT_64208 [Trametes elegans]